MTRDRPLAAPATAEVRAAAATALGREVVDVDPIAEGLNAVYRVAFARGDPAVLKAATLATDDVLLGEARLIDRVAAGTAVPAPELLGTLPAGEGPLSVASFLTAYRAGRTVPDLLDLPPAARERLVRESGRHLAALHALDVGDRFGTLRVEDGRLVTDPGRTEWPVRFRDLVAEAVEGLRGEGVTTDDDPRFADLAPVVREALTGSGVGDGPAVADGSAVDRRPTDPAVVYGDYRPANLVLAPGDDADPIVRAVVDFGGCDVGDARLDVALAEDALVDVPLGGTDRAETLRRAFRSAYRAARDPSGPAADRWTDPGTDPPAGPASDPRYPRYRLYARVRHLGGFDYWSRFAREDDPDAVARRWRSFVRERLGELG